MSLKITEEIVALIRLLTKMGLSMAQTAKIVDEVNSMTAEERQASQAAADAAADVEMERTKKHGKK